MKIDPTCLENKEFEICIKSKSGSHSEFPINEQLCLHEDYFKEEKFVGIVKISQGRDGSHYVRYSNGSPTEPLKYSNEKASSEAETKKESTSAGIQTTNLEVLSSNKLEDTRNQSDNARSSKTQAEMIESGESETEDIFQNPTALYTEKETVPMSAQTETAAIFPSENECGISTHIQNTEKIANKSLNIENLPLYPLMATKSEKITSEENKIEKNCRCSCGHKKQHDCIYNCKSYY